MPFFLVKNAHLNLAPCAYFRIDYTRTCENLIGFNPKICENVEVFKFKKYSTFDNYIFINKKGAMLRQFELPIHASNYN